MKHNTHYEFQEVFTEDMDKPRYEITISTDNKYIYEKVRDWFEYSVKEVNEDGE